MKAIKMIEKPLNLITICLLIAAFPLGVILMWFITKWPKPIKVLVTVLPTLILLLSFFFFFWLGSKVRPF